MVLSSQPIINTKIKILYRQRPEHSVFPLQIFRVHLKSKDNIVNACSHVWRALSIVESTALDYSLRYQRSLLQISTLMLAVQRR